MNKHDFVGTKWYKCDLHIHTPASKCFLQNVNTDDEKTFEEFLNNFIAEVVNKKLDCIAITDHNSAKLVDKIKEKAIEKNIICFPGVELTCSSKVHLLVLFNIDKTKADIDSFLSSLNILPDHFGKQEAYTEKSLEEIINQANLREAIVIPAHIDEYSSIYNLGSQCVNKYFENENINAVQVVNENFVERYYEDKDKLVEDIKEKYEDEDIDIEKIKGYKKCIQTALRNNLAMLTFSDNPDENNRKKHSISGIGNKYTWIKMGLNPKIEDLRNALLLNNLRIKNCFDNIEYPYNPPDFWIESISIKGTKIIKNPNFKINFSPQMTIIIGGRGSGKSVIVRFIRKILGRIGDIKSLNDIYKEYNHFFNKENDVIDENSKSEMIVYNNDVKYKLSVSGLCLENPEIKVEKFDYKSKEYMNVELNMLDLFNVEVYSQKQVYEVANKPNILRNRIDQSIDKIKDIHDDMKTCKNKYLENLYKYEELEELEKRRTKVKLDIRDIDEKIKKYEDCGIKELLDLEKTYNDDKLIIDKYKNLAEIIHTQCENVNIDYNDKLEKTYRNDLGDILELFLLKMKDITKKIDEIKNLSNNLKNEFSDIVSKSEWKKEKEKCKTKLREFIEKEFGEENSINKLLESVKIKKDQEIEYSKKIKKLNDGLLNKEDIKREYLNNRENLSALRNEYLEYIKKNDVIKVEVAKFKDSEYYEEQFRNIIQKADSYKDDIDKIMNEVFKSPNIVNKLKDFNNKIRRVRDNEEGIFSVKFNKLLKKLNKEQVAELDMLYPEDRIIIKYKGNDENSYNELENASAGQKTSAILAFILGDGNKPLIIDQPEDDLDNHLINCFIVESLKKSKNNRQIIVITHNANIPVNGDAEFIVAMDSKSRYIDVYASGIIEEERIKKEICGVMEGGEDAFVMRAKRYNIKS